MLRLSKSIDGFLFVCDPSLSRRSEICYKIISQTLLIRLNLARVLFDSDIKMIFFIRKSKFSGIFFSHIFLILIVTIFHENQYERTHSPHSHHTQPNMFPIISREIVQCCCYFFSIRASTTEKITFQFQFTLRWIKLSIALNSESRAPLWTVSRISINFLMKKYLRTN